MMAQFDISYGKTAEKEGIGEYSNHPDDRGGATFSGISRHYHPTWKGWVYLDAGRPEMAATMVKPFYRTEFWDRLMLDHVLDQEIADEVFDTAVNCGISKAVKIAQEALRLLGKDIEIDGIMGFKTISMLNEYKFKRSLMKALNGLQFEHYSNLVKTDPTQLVFFRGWMERI